MSLIYSPFGMRPLYSPSGILRPAANAYSSGGGLFGGGGTIASGYNTNIFANGPVQIDSQTPSGNLIIVPAQGAASATDLAKANRIIGAFQGVEFTLTATGRRTVSNYWPAGTVATNIVAWFTRDTEMIYEIQANGPVSGANVGAQASITANNTNSGNTTTGFSSVGLDVTTANSLTPPAANGFNQLEIVGFSQRADNAPGDAFTIVQCRIAAHQDRVGSASY